MSRVTQHNAATTEESAAAAEELSSQATSVQQMVQSFRLSSARTIQAPLARIGGGVRQFKAPAPPRSHARQRASLPPLAATGTGDARAVFPLDDDKVLEQF